MTNKGKYRLFSYKIFLLLSLFWILSGCTSPQEPMPKIVYGPENEHLFASPTIELPKPSIDDSYDEDVPRAWLPPASAEKRWKAIIIHHSATEKGNAAIFNKWHTEQLGWDGVGYDFVIGNGTDSGDGQVEVTFRWRQQITGAHCKTPDNWANENGIGICLVGHFNNYTPTEQQMQSLVKLTNFLCKRYNIPKSEISGHGNTRGARVTDCPGKMFPMSRFKSMLDY